MRGCDITGKGSVGPTFDVVEGWGGVPEGWELTMVPGVAVDSKDRVYVFCRGTHPVVVFNREGRFLRSWGDGVFTTPHFIHIDRGDNVWLVDSGDHTVRKYTTEGEHMLTMGEEGVPGEEGEPFNRPADIYITESGEAYVADGYGNSRVHKYSRDGEHLFSWGVSGDGPGEFNLPHGVWVEEDEGRVWVADRQNGRLQIFTLDGEYVDEWGGFLQPCNVYMDGEKRVYVPELQARMTVLSQEGEILTRWGGERSHAPGEFFAPHDACVDSHGDLYVGESLAGARVQKFALRV